MAVARPAATPAAPKLNPLVRAIDDAILALWPAAGLQRIRARAAADLMRAMAYEGATLGRRTAGWYTSGQDANAALMASLPKLRERSHDLVRNNPLAARAVDIIAHNMVGWGIVPKPRADTAGERAKKRAMELWQAHCETTQIDPEGSLNVYGLMDLAARTVVESGEVLLRRRWRTAADRLTLPFQVQVLEPDFLDTTRDGTLKGGNVVIQGVEFDGIGRRVAYWLYPEHPGTGTLLKARGFESKRVPADDVLHVFLRKRPGQVRGVPWVAPIILKMRDLDELADATLVKQKVAALLVGVITDPDGPATTSGTTTPPGAAIGTPGAPNTSTVDPVITTMEPGTLMNGAGGGGVTFSTPPSSADYAPFTNEIKHEIAAGLGVTFEQLTGDFSKVNFSSARMARIEFQQSLHNWRWHMFIPQGCDGLWRWTMEAGVMMGALAEAPRADWTPPPLPMIDPAVEGKAYRDNVRAGVQTLADVVREQGYDPEAHFDEIAKTNAKLDEKGIILDSDPRNTTQVGGPREQAAAAPAGGDAAGGGGERNSIIETTMLADGRILAHRKTI